MIVIPLFADGLDGNHKVSIWQLCLHSGLTWAWLNCDFGEGDSETEGNDDHEVKRC